MQQKQNWKGEKGQMSKTSQNVRAARRIRDYCRKMSHYGECFTSAYDLYDTERGQCMVAPDLDKRGIKPQHWKLPLTEIEREIDIANEVMGIDIRARRD